MNDSSWLYDLRSVSFAYKANPSQLLYGFIAEEVSKVDSTAVIVDKDGNPQSIHTDSILAAAVKEIQDLRKEVTNLKQQLEG